MLRQKGWTQAAFGEAVGVARQTVGNWVNDAKPPRRRAARDIARVLGVEENEVLARAGYPTPPEYKPPWLEEHTEPEIDLADPELHFWASTARALTAEEYAAIKEIARQIMRAKQGGGDRGVGG